MCRASTSKATVIHSSPGLLPHKVVGCRWRDNEHGETAVTPMPGTVRHRVAAELQLVEHGTQSAWRCWVRLRWDVLVSVCDDAQPDPASGGSGCDRDPLLALAARQALRHRGIGHLFRGISHLFRRSRRRSPQRNGANLHGCNPYENAPEHVLVHISPPWEQTPQTNLLLICTSSEAEPSLHCGTGVDNPT